MQQLTAIKAKALIQDLSGLRTIREEWFRQALEIALPILEQQDRGEWIDWSGGERPVGGCELVVAKLRDGTVLIPLSAGHLAWWHNKPGFFNGRDIIAYRIIPERATNQNGEES